MAGTVSGRDGVGMSRTSRLANVTLNIRAGLAICRGTWRLCAGRPPWQSRRAAARRR